MPFYQKVKILVLGNASIHVLSLLLLPILTHLYSPAIFGLYVAYLSVFTIISAIIALRYEMAISLAHDAKSAANMLFTSCSIALTASILLLGLLILFKPLIISLPRWQPFNQYIYLLPCTVLLAGLTNCLSYWLIREQKIADLMMAKVIQISVTLAIQVGIGYHYMNLACLLLGHTLGFFISICYIAQKNLLLTKLSSLGLQLKKAIDLLKRYQKFPKFSLPATLTNALSQHVPTLLIASMFSIKDAAFYGLAIQLIRTPLSLLSKSIGQAYLSEGSQLVNNDIDSLRRLYLRSVIIMLFVSIPIIILITFGGSYLFNLLFQPEWQNTFVFLKIITWSACVEFAIVGPSKNFSLLERQELALIWNAIYLSLILSLFIVIYTFKVDIYTSIIYLTLVRCGVYFLMFILNLNALNRKAYAHYTHAN